MAEAKRGLLMSSLDPERCAKPLVTDRSVPALESHFDHSPLYDNCRSLLEDAKGILMQMTRKQTELQKLCVASSEGTAEIFLSGLSRGTEPSCAGVSHVKLVGGVHKDTAPACADDMAIAGQAVLDAQQDKKEAHESVAALKASLSKAQKDLRWACAWPQTKMTL